MPNETKFENDSDRHAWREYAKTAEMAIMTKGEIGPPTDGHIGIICATADRMLDEERKRRPGGKVGNA
jgi:hypothetical protein